MGLGFDFTLHVLHQESSGCNDDEAGSRIPRGGSRAPFVTVDDAEEDEKLGIFEGFYTT